MVSVARRLVPTLLLLLAFAVLVPALEPFENHGEPLVVSDVDRLIIDSLVDFDVEVRGRNTDSLRMEVISSRRRAQEIYFEERGGVFRIEQRRRRSLWRILPRRLLITVPLGVPVEIETLTGSVRLEGIGAPGVLRTSTGDIGVSDHDGSLNATTASGSVTVDGGSGRTVLRSSSGSVRVANRRGRFVVETAAGDIRVRNSLLEESSSFLTSAGNIDLRLRNSRDDVRGNLDSGTGDLILDGAPLEGPLEDPEGAVLLLARTASGNLRIATDR